MVASIDNQVFKSFERESLECRPRLRRQDGTYLGTVE
jgi:hypothetical protein